MDTQKRPVMIRIPIELHEAIAALAELSDRSVSAQIVQMLRGVIEGKQDSR